MIELGSRHPLASANRGTRCYPLRIESKEGLRPTQTVPLHWCSSDSINLPHPDDHATGRTRDQFLTVREGELSLDLKG